MRWDTTPCKTSRRPSRARSIWKIIPPMASNAIGMEPFVPAPLPRRARAVAFWSHSGLRRRQARQERRHLARALALSIAAHLAVLALQFDTARLAPMASMQSARPSQSIPDVSVVLMKPAPAPASAATAAAISSVRNSIPPPASSAAMSLQVAPRRSTRPTTLSPELESSTLIVAASPPRESELPAPPSTTKADTIPSSPRAARPRGVRSQSGRPESASPNRSLLARTDREDETFQCTP